MAKKKLNIRAALIELGNYAPEIQELLALPCCHTSGMHDPQHFEHKKYVCNDQEAAALERFCKLIGINPVTKCGENCGWCRENKNKHKGAGLALFWPNEDVVKAFEKQNSGWQATPTVEIAEKIAIVLKRNSKYKNVNKDFQREWKRFLESEKDWRNNRTIIGRKESFGRNSEGTHVTAPLSKYRFRVSGKKSQDYQPYELERLVINALRHSKRIFGL